MAVFIRAKRVSDPLDRKVRAQLLSSDHCHMTGYATSGSEHHAAVSGLVHAFLDMDEPNAAVSDHDDTGSDDDDSDNGDPSIGTVATLHNLLDPSRKSDPFCLRLHADVVKAAEALSGLRWNGSGYRRAVMARLREGGYNAGICKARWEKCGGLNAGSYEYIDVVEKELGERYLVDLEFATEFEVARATEEYGNLVMTLPRVVVARPEEVKQVVRILATAASRSLKKKELHVPPWRKSGYMIAKWLWPYRRTVNAVPSLAGSAVYRDRETKCRSVGFRPLLV